MSKSSGGPDDPNRILLEQILKALVEGKENNYKSQSSYEDLKYRAEVNQRVDINKVIDKTTFEKLIRAVEQQNKHMGVATTSNFNQGDWKSFKDTMKNSMKDFEKIGVTADQMLKAILTYRNVILSEANVTEKRGYKSSTYSNVADNKNKELKELLAEMRKSTAASGAIDSAMHKVMDFVTGPPLKKTLKQVGADLIEGLEKSKWVGGALHDTFRLIGLLGANWLSQFGELGRILGASFYVAMETFGPQLAKLLVEGVIRGTAGLSKALWGLVGSIGTLLGGVASKLIYKSGGPILDLMTAPTAAGKAAALGKVGGGLGAIAAGGWAISQGVDSWKQGRRGNAAALGIGGAGLIAGGAAVLAGVAAPITVPLIAISGAVAGIAVLWKHHSETIKKWAGKFGSFVNKVIDFMALWNPVFKAIQWIRDHWPGAGKGGSGNGGFLGLGSIGGNNANKGTGIADSIIDNKKGNYVTYGKMKVSKRDGSILNLNELSQNEASEALQMYEKADPTSFHRVYEWLSGDKASLASHSTDAVKKVNGKTVAALSKKGTSQEIDDLRSLLVGMSPEKAAEFVQTSGKLTGSNTQHGVGGWKSHNNPYALGIDLAGGSSWTARDYLDNYEVVKKYYNARGFEVNLERPGQGKSTGWHYDIKPMRNIRPEGAQENFENYNNARATETTTKMMGISEVVKSLDTEDKRRFAEELKEVKAGSPEELAKKEEAILNKMGIYSDVNTNSWMRNTANGTESLWYDAAGNARWREVMTTMQGAEVGSTGR